MHDQISSSSAVASCPNCGKRFQVRTDQFGKRAKCRGCGEPFEIVPYVAVEEPELVEETYDAPPPPPLPPPPVPRRASSHRAGLSGIVTSAIGQKILRLGGSALLLIVFVGIGYLKYTTKQARRERLAQRIDEVFIKPSQSEPERRDVRDIPRPPTVSQPPAPNASAIVAAATKPPPKLNFRTDSAGRKVGEANASIRSKRTKLTLVLPPGTHAAKSLPCVFVCPAGSNLLTGVNWGDDEQEDFYGLLERGVAVCCYSLDGTLSESVRDNEMAIAIAMRDFVRSGGGLANLQDAIDTVVAGEPSIDSKRLGACGHSSAATVALTGAKGDRRIVAVAAMAPAMDLPKRLAPIIDQLDGPSTATIYQMNPASIESLTADVFIFHASDDDHTPASEVSEFAAKHGRRVTLKLVPTGGHFGVYEEGRPACFDFLAERLGAKALNKPAAQPS